MTLRTVFERRLGHGPLVLVIEDMQWADAASVDSLRTMADWLHARQLTIVLTGRPAFTPAALAFGRAAHAVVQLPPLPDAGIEAIHMRYPNPAS